MSLLVCPVDGCNRSSTSTNGLASHLHQSESEGHEQWTTWNEAAEHVHELASDGDEPLVRELDNDNDDADELDVDGTGDGTGDGARVVDPPTPGDSTDESGSNPRGSTGGTDPGTDPGCPRCGQADYFSPTPFGITHDDVDDVDPGDELRGCPDCSTGETWVIYGV